MQVTEAGRDPSINCMIVPSSGHFLASSRENRRKPVGKSENPTTSGLPNVSKQFKLPQTIYLVTLITYTIY
jgi:hypothetical protein